MKQRKLSSSNRPTENNAHPYHTAQSRGVLQVRTNRLRGSPPHPAMSDTSRGTRYLQYDSRLMMLDFEASGSPGVRVTLKDQHSGSSRCLWTPQSDTGTSVCACISLNPGTCSLMDCWKGQGCMFSFFSYAWPKGSSDSPFPALKCRRSNLVGNSIGCFLLLLPTL